MRVLLAIPLFALSLLASAAFASDAEIIEAIESGKLKIDTKVALPEAEAAAPALPGSAGESQNLFYAITQAEESAITNKAFPLLAAKWPFNTIFVCWENPANDNQRERSLVREAVAKSWEKYSALEFIGWNKCTPTFKGVRIVIEDGGPHVKYIGKYLAYDREGRGKVVKNGMLLNFTFDSWSPSCKQMRDQCIYSIAVHEFGHAIGLAHEQNRPDTPGECTEAPQGPDGDNITLTPWDKDSVMNYCNEKYNNEGELSAFDIKATRYIYGEN